MQWHPIIIIIIVKDGDRTLPNKSHANERSKFAVTQVGTKSGQEFTQVHRGAWCTKLNK